MQKQLGMCKNCASRATSFLSSPYPGAEKEIPQTMASILRRLLHDLRQFQSDRWLRAEVLREGFDEQHIGIADAHRVKGLAGNERLKSQFFAAPVPPAVSAAGANRTQPPSP
jgi:hypothetical protein